MKFTEVRSEDLVGSVRGDGEEGVLTPNPGDFAPAQVYYVFKQV